MYTEMTHGFFDSWLLYDDEVIAYTDNNICVAIDHVHKEKIEEYANYYKLPIEWRE